MKRSFNILLAAVILVGMQACGPKAGKDSTQAEPTTSPVVKVALTSSEKKARLEKERAEWIEKRRIRLEKQVALTRSFTDAQGNVIYYQAEVNPTYNGGDDAMQEYLRTNLKYPEGALEKGIEGTVFVDFIVTQLGNVRAAEVTDTTNEDVDQSLRDEALRVVTSMPKWKPGNQNGRAVAVKFSIPITFEMK